MMTQLNMVEFKFNIYIFESLKNRIKESEAGATFKTIMIENILKQMKDIKP